MPRRYLPMAEGDVRFLATPTPRRIHIGVVVEALIEAEVETVGYVSYGMKTPAYVYRDALDELPSSTIIHIDIGFVGYESSNPNMLPVCRFDSRRVVELGGRSREFPMFSHITSDSASSSGRRPFGTIKWSAPSRRNGGIIGRDVDAIKLYPGFVHVMKAHLPTSVTMMPTTFRQSSLRLAALKNFNNILLAYEVRSREEDDDVAARDLHRQCRYLRCEVSIRLVVLNVLLTYLS